MSYLKTGSEHHNWRPLEERFWEKVKKTDLCWFWMASRNPKGYGLVWVDGHYKPASRVAYELCIGPVEAGMHVDHLCRNHACVNPDHLEAVTHAENLRRGERGILKTHCINGHRWIEENIYHAPSGGRGCAICRREHTREWRKRQAMAATS